MRGTYSSRRRAAENSVTLFSFDQPWTNCIDNSLHLLSVQLEIMYFSDFSELDMIIKITLISSHILNLAPMYLDSYFR